jgi:hypothetical protein
LRTPIDFCARKKTQKKTHNKKEKGREGRGEKKREGKGRVGGVVDTHIYEISMSVHSGHTDIETGSRAYNSRK